MCAPARELQTSPLRRIRPSSDGRPAAGALQSAQGDSAAALTCAASVRLGVAFGRPSVRLRVGAVAQLARNQEDAKLASSRNGPFCRRTRRCASPAAAAPCRAAGNKRAAGGWPMQAHAKRMASAAKRSFGSVLRAALSCHLNAALHHKQRFVSQANSLSLSRSFAQLLRPAQRLPARCRRRPFRASNAANKFPVARRSGVVARAATRNLAALGTRSPFLSRFLSRNCAQAYHHLEAARLETLSTRLLLP